MKCPCENCLVYIRCKQRVLPTTIQNKGTYYIFDSLIEECDQLREFFGINTLTHRIKLKSIHTRMYRQDTVMSYIKDTPHGEQLVKQFLDIMKLKDPPPTFRCTLNIKVKMKGKK